MKKDASDTLPPFTYRQVNRGLIVIIVVLALFSGYFHAKFTNEQHRATRFQKKLVELQEKYDTVLLEASPAATINE